MHHPPGRIDHLPEEVIEVQKLPARGAFLPFDVVVFEGAIQHDLGDFRRLEPACAAARLALTRPSNTLAVVKDRDGCLVYAVDRSKEWTG